MRSSNRNNATLFAAFERGGGIERGHRRFTCAGLPDDERRCPRLLPAAEHLVERLDAGFDQMRRCGAYSGPRKDAGKDDDAFALADRHVMIAVGDGHALHLAYLDPAPDRAIFLKPLVETNDAMRDAVDLLARAITFMCLGVEQQRHDVSLGQKGFEGDKFAAETRRISGDQPDLEKRVINEACRLMLVDRAFDRLAGLVEP